MEKNREDLARWVDARMAALDGAGDWEPDSERGLAAVLRRRRIRRAESIGVMAAALAAGLVLVALSGPRACASPVECAIEAEQAGSIPTGLVRNYKVSGSPSAKVTCEIYSDYQCPSCAAAFASTVPQFVNEYVKTGKVMLIHRDFPLPQHQYSRLATRYINAAGELGFYDAAVDYMFRNQSVWEKDGSVDAQLAKLLPPQSMQKVRLLVQNDPSLDQSVSADMVMAAKDKINQTPSMIIAANGKRQLIVPIPGMPLLRSYLNDLLK
jgi:protein-disulfide isomerase